LYETPTAEIQFAPGYALAEEIRESEMLFFWIELEVRFSLHIARWGNVAGMTSNGTPYSWIRGTDPLSIRKNCRSRKGVARIPYVSCWKTLPGQVQGRIQATRGLNGLILLSEHALQTMACPAVKGSAQGVFRKKGSMSAKPKKEREKTKKQKKKKKIDFFPSLPNPAKATAKTKKGSTTRLQTTKESGPWGHNAPIGRHCGAKHRK